jgi:hypothetical protein
VWRIRRPGIRTIVFVIAVVEILALVGACAYETFVEGQPIEDGLAFVYVNRTDEPLQFYLQAVGPTPQKDQLVAPHAEARSGWNDPGNVLRIMATRPDWATVFDRTYTPRQLKEANYRIEVTSLQPVH